MRRNFNIKNNSKNGSRPKVNVKVTFKRLLNEIFKANPILFPIVIICIIFTAIVSSIPGIFIQNIIHVIETAPADATWSEISKDIFYFITILIIFDFISLISTTFFNRKMADITQSTQYSIRKKMFEQMQKLPIKFFDKESHGDIMSYYTNDIDTLRQLVSQGIPQLIFSSVIIINVFSIMLYYSFLMTLVVLIGVAFMYFTTKYVGKHSRKYFVKQQQSLGKTEGFLEEMIYGQKVVKIFNHEDEALKKFNKVNDELFEDAEKANAYANILAPILNNIGNILYVFVAIFGGILIIYKVPNVSFSGLAISVSIVVPFLNMTKQFSGNINQLSMQVNHFVMALAGVERVFKIIDEKEEIDEGNVTLENGFWKNDNKLVKVEGNIDIKEISFSYTEEKQIISNLTINAKSGEKIALVGATGSGKTTIANLINRFYDVNSGEILFDGINVNQIRKKDLRKSVGVVLQETNLFTATIFENLRYGNLSATDEDCIEACKKTGAHEFIMKLPNQYETVIKGSGDNLSQGQRQLIGISRALLEDKPVLILDEATSSIDTKTEQVVQNAMYVLMQGRCVFIIAHRLSTISNSDKIIVLDSGKILEQGTHDELIEKQGRYYELYTGKFELD